MSSNLALNIAVKAQNQTNAAFAQVAAAQTRVKLAVDQAKLSYDRYVQAMTSAKATQAQMQVAADKVAIAFDRVKVAEANVTTATERAKSAQQQMATATKEEGNALSTLKEHLGESSSSLMEFGSKLSMIFFGIQNVIGMMQGLAESAMRLGASMIAPNAAMEQATIAMKTLIPAAGQAQQMLDSLWQFAARTPFQFPDIDAAAQKLIAFGESAKNVIPDLTAIGDSLSALGRATPAELQGVVTIFGKIDAQGKLMTRDMMMLANYGINAWKFLGQQLHVTHAQLQVMVTKGLIPAQEAIALLRKGMEGVFGGGMQKQALTFNGLLTTLKDNFQLAWRNMTGPLFQAAKNGLVDLGKLAASPAFQNFARMIGTTLAPAFRVIGSDIHNIVSGLQAWLNNKGNMAGFQGTMKSLANTIYDVWRAIKKVGDYLPAAAANFDQWSKAMDLSRTAGDNARVSYATLGDVIGGVIVSIAGAIGFFVGAFNTVMYLLGKFADGLNLIAGASNAILGTHFGFIDTSGFHGVDVNTGAENTGRGSSGNFGGPGSSSSPGSSSGDNTGGTGGTGGTGTGSGKGKGGVKSQQFTASDIADILKNARAMHLKFNEHMFAMLSTSQKIKYLWQLVGQHMDKLDKLMSNTHGGLLAYLQWILTGKKGSGLILDNGQSGNAPGSTGGSSSGKYNANLIVVNNVNIYAGNADAAKVYDMVLKRLERDLRRSGNISSMLSGGKSQ